MKLYFYYGTMGSSKTANALMTKFNMEEHGNKVLLLKPSIDTRDGETIIRSRAGLEAESILVYPDSDIKDILSNYSGKYNGIIVDECQFLTEAQIDQLRETNEPMFIMCYGLKTDYMGKLFEGSKRLLEVSDSIREIKSMCPCGKKAIMNARYDKNGNIIYNGGQIDIGGDDMYRALCYDCWKKGKVSL